MAENRHLNKQNSFLSSLEGMLKFGDKLPASKTYNYLSSDEQAHVCHAKNMLLEMYKYYQENKFCDVTLVVGGNEINTHRLVLGSCSSYFSHLFNNNWKDSEQESCTITEFDEETMKCILDFAYTGNLDVNPSNVLGVLTAADFFQLVELDFIKKSVGDYLTANVNKDNCATMIVITEQFQVQAQDTLAKYAAENFYQVAQTEGFLELSIELLVKILECEQLVVDRGKDFLPLPAQQEDFVVDVVLKYLSYQSDNYGQQTELLLKKLCLSNSIYFHCLSPSSLEKLYKFIDNANCSESLRSIIQEKNEAQGSPRKGRLSKDNYCNIHAHRVHVGPIQSEFGDEPFIQEANLFIQGMKIWIRLWDGRQVIGGLKVFYSNGESPMYGGNDGEVHEFHLDDDERIVKAEVHSGWMVDNLTFFTNKGKELGPYGGYGGGEYHEEPRGKYGFLSYLKGAVAVAQEKPGIIKLKLVWKGYLVDHSDSEEDDSENLGYYFNGTDDIIDEDEYYSYLNDYED